MTCAAGNDLGAERGASAAFWWRVADCGVLGLWLATVISTLRYHEKWADEAQAWMLVRELDLKTLWFHELRYEGSPGLWHMILWVAQRVFHASYAALGPIGVACATTGVGLLIFKAPFPRYIRWPLAFTYVMIYQYAVISRPYTLLALLVFGAAIAYRDLTHPWRLTVVLVFLAALTFHGTVLAGCFGLTYLIEAKRAWHKLDSRVRRQYFICITVMALTFLFLLIVLKPPPDVEQLAFKAGTVDVPAAAAQSPSPMVRFRSVICGAFLDYWVPSLVFLALTGFWFFVRRNLLVFPFPVAALICLYVMLQGVEHHHGTVFLAAIASIWIAWPTAQEQLRFNTRERRAQQVMVGLLLCLCAVNIWDAEVAIRRERQLPYSGAEATANYLKSIQADRGRIVGFLYGVVAVQPYFDHNIFMNFPAAYFHHGLPLAGFVFDPVEFRKMNPDYVVAASEQPQIMMDYGISVLRNEGYDLERYYDGFMIYKRGYYAKGGHQSYFILRRRRPRR